MRQNIWEQRKAGLHRQKRRAQLVTSYLKKSHVKRILDIGSAEGYATSFISITKAFVVGIEINMESLRIAKEKVKNIEFINASIDNLPFREGVFDAVCILEVLEHLEIEIQKKGLEDVDRILCNKGNLVISVPYKESIIQTKCIHCGKDTPLYGHLHSLSELDIQKILPHADYRLLTKYRLPNIQLISCKDTFEPLPLQAWLFLNEILGFISKGYWIVLHYVKDRR